MKLFNSSNTIIIIVSIIISFILTGNIVNNMDLPIIKDTVGAPAAGIYNLIIGYPIYLMIFLPIMGIFTIIFISFGNYLFNKK